MNLYSVIISKVSNLAVINSDDIFEDHLQFDCDSDLEATNFSLSALHAGYTVECFLNGEPFDLGLEVEQLAS